MVARPILLTKKSGAFACRELQTSTHRAAEKNILTESHGPWFVIFGHSDVPII